MELFAKLWETLTTLLVAIRDAFSTRDWPRLLALWLAAASITQPQVAAFLLDEVKFKLPITYGNTPWLLGALAVGVLGVGLVLGLAPPIKDPPPPSDAPAIKELLPFEAKDKDVFAQLERQLSIRRCLGMLEEPDFRFGILYGDSGNGKTSFLRAGLRPQMEHPERCVYVKFTDLPPLEAVQLAVAAQVSGPPSQASTLPALLAEVGQAAPQPLVLIFDQFEQYFLHLPGPLTEDAFALGLRDWYAQRPPLPVKILVSLRADFMDRLLDLQALVGFGLGDGASLRLEKFSPEQARNVWRIMASQAGIPFDEAFALQLAEHELASREPHGLGSADQGRIAPVNVQIVAAMLVAQDKAADRAFTEAAFNRLGGVDGLLERFLELRLEARLTPSRRETAVRVLLALTDQERATRAGVLGEDQIARKSGLAPTDVHEAVDWLEKARLLTAVEQGQAGQGYELAHERLIKPLLKVAGGTLRPMAQANYLLDRRVNEWLGNGRSPRFLLTLREWWLIRRHRTELVWGDKRPEKQELLARTQRRWQSWGGVLAGLVLLAGLGWVGWHSDECTVWRSRQQLYALAVEYPAEGFIQANASKAYLMAGDYEQALALARNKNLNISVAVLDSIAPAIYQSPDSTQAIKMLDSVLRACAGANVAQRASVLGVTAQIYGKFSNHARAVAGLDSVRKATAGINSYKARVLAAVAQAYGQLHDPAGLEAVLQDTVGLKDDTDEILAAIVDGYSQLHNSAKLDAVFKATAGMDDRTAVLTALAQAYGQHQNAAGLNVVLQAAMDVDKAGYSYNADLLCALAQAYGQLHSRNQATSGLKSVFQIAVGMGDNGADVLAAVAQAYGQLHDPAGLEAVVKAASRMSDSIYDKFTVLSGIARAYGCIHNPAGLKSLCRFADSRDGFYKKHTYPAIAQAYSQLGDPAGLDAMVQATNRITPGYKVAVLSAIAEAYGQLSNSTRAAAGLEVIRQAATEMDGDHRMKLLPAIAQAYGHLHLYRQAYALSQGVEPESKRAQPLYELLEAWQARQSGPPKPAGSATTN